MVTWSASYAPRSPVRVIGGRPVQLAPPPPTTSFGPANDADGGIEARATDLAIAHAQYGSDLMRRAMTMFEIAGWNRAQLDVPAVSPADLMHGRPTWLVGFEAGWLAWHIVHHDELRMDAAIAEMEDL
jgi:hypothetical protein